MRENTDGEKVVLGIFFAAVFIFLIASMFEGVSKEEKRELFKAAPLESNITYSQGPIKYKGK